MSGTELLNFSNANAIDPFFRKAQFEFDAVTQKPNTPFYYSTWATITNWAQRIRPIDPYNTLQGYGSGENIFKIDSSAWLRGPLQLKVVRSALSGQGGATFARFVDWEGYAMIEYVELRYGPNHCYRIEGDELLIRTRLMTPWSRLESIKELVFGDKTPTERDTLAASTQTLYVDIPFPYCLSPKMWLPAATTSHPLEVRLKFRPLSAITQTDGTSHPTGSVISAQLISLDIYLTTLERRFGEARVKSAKGILYRILDFEHQQDIIQSGSTSYVIPLTHLRGAAVEIIVVIRQRSLVEASLPTTNQSRTTYTQIAQMEIKSGSNQVMDLLDDRYIRFVLNNRYHSGLAGDFIYAYSFSLEPENLFVALGHKTLASMTTPQLYIYFSSALAAESIVDTYIIRNNLWSLAGGELKKVFD